ncbi:ethanolamine utilization protein EutN [Heliobacterium gestii]|uniref:Ethanolamine utilization protein EutN n=1 Tax=Heliomicrobium gestii TaxID=2699 RepID=A0A845LD53_HELGE|nr:EutN/CcmL family microcompartment protein [Heliomicrobium gestii]MBM7866983.1 ethanolamine utilization protein EutN [Heliomicrobium gestii]MZP42405.1 ethanolamine utilization protein EutN [Heliomicrobium gestii]
MWIGTVVGNVVSTSKDESLVGSKLLIVKPMSNSSANKIGLIVAVDTVGAGNGERVLVLQGTSARLILSNKNSAVDAAIVGIIDSVELDERLLHDAD